jgi:hypothetical protein
VPKKKKISKINLTIKIQTLYDDVSLLNDESGRHSCTRRNRRQLSILQDVVSISIKEKKITAKKLTVKTVLIYLT